MDAHLTTRYASSIVLATGHLKRLTEESVAKITMHVIERRSDGYAPPLRLIRYVLGRAKVKGFRTDWDCCGVLETDALAFGYISEEAMRPSDLIAVKLSGEWRFFTDREYLDLLLPVAADGGKK